MRRQPGVTDNNFGEEGIIFNRMKLSMKDEEVDIEKYQRETFQTKVITSSNAPRQAWHI